MESHTSKIEQEEIFPPTRAYLRGEAQGLFRAKILVERLISELDTAIKVGDVVEFRKDVDLLELSGFGISVGNEEVQLVMSKPIVVKQVTQSNCLVFNESVYNYRVEWFEKVVK
ncbi:MAG: hypothetical protein EOM67_17000 [Spirochaetia bacterium]|nr:hypothetical protein [Spirochaetia bacterium]